MHKWWEKHFILFMTWNKRKKKRLQRLAWVAAKMWWSDVCSYQSGSAGTLDNDSAWATVFVLCDLWVFHFKIEPLRKTQVSSVTWGSSAQEFAMAQVWLLLGHCGDTRWKTVHKPNIFHIYFNICKQQQAAFYASRHENTCKNWNRFLYFHQALQTEPLTVYRLSF